MMKLIVFFINLQKYVQFCFKLFGLLYVLRVFCLGQDCYKRCYWIFFYGGGVFVEGLDIVEKEIVFDLKFEGEELNESM